jgi:deoxyadenosine/deoxycytidine kinase
MENKYIVIEGNIGAGKTSLATRFAHDTQSRLILEEFAENTFLPKFYENPERYAFPVELSFLSERYSQLKKELQTRDLFSPRIVADYFISKCQIFAKNNLQTDEYALFLKMFEIVEASVPKPDLIVYLYLGVEQLQANIRRRGRAYEQNITDTYLDNIQRQYIEFIRQHEDLRVVIVDTSQLDFVNNEDDYQTMKRILEDQYPTGVYRIDPKA